ncbi:MAG: DUF3108 domain-containing protein [Hyphomicrobiales bacterium]|nr:DUF3108 domain-containing protein [Hyphomicrobiales bacterium]
MLCYFRNAVVIGMGLTMLPLAAAGSEQKAWPVSFEAHYSLQFRGIEVGRLKLKSQTSGASYSVAASAKVSVLFGAYKFSGATSTSGTIEQGEPTPSAYKFSWRKDKKLKKAIQLGFSNKTATDISIQPKPRVKPDTVPLLEKDKIGKVDPLSAVMILTKADGRPPCDRSVEIFDGNHRFDIVLEPKRRIKLPPSSAGRRPEIGHVCRITYTPIAGHRDNAETKARLADQNAEIVLRHVPGSDMLIPYAVNIPTKWGTGTMLTERIDVMPTSSRKIAFTN